MHSNAVRGLLKSCTVAAHDLFSIISKTVQSGRCRGGNRELKQRQRRRQRERQKRDRFRLAKQQLCTCITLFCTFLCRRCTTPPRGPRGSQSGREKRRDESFQVREKEPLGTDSHQTISKNSSECLLLIGHKK